MPVNIVNPYTGEDAETCSVSVVAQQQMASGVSSPQTEAEFNKSKLLGEWGVIKAKLARGDIPTGTKVLTYTTTGGTRGYLVKNSGKNTLTNVLYTKSGKKLQNLTDASKGEQFIKSGIHQVAIPQAVSAKPKPEPVKVVYGESGFTSADKASHKPGAIVAVGTDQYIKMSDTGGKYELYEAADFGYVKAGESSFLSSFMDDEVTWYKPDGKNTTPNVTPAVAKPDPPSSTQVAAPTPATPVEASSTSVGSMSHEDVAAMFVKIKDDLAKEQGLNIKGANPELDKVVYQKIGEATGYTAAEVKGKVDAYKAQGNKLSALKKKVLAGTKKVPEGKPAPVKQTKPSGPLAQPTVEHPDGKVVAASPDGQKQLIAHGGGYMLQQKHAIFNTWYDAKKYSTIEDAKKAEKSLLSKASNDPQPHGVPTVATPAVANAVKEEVKAEVTADPAKVYSDEDIAAQYIIAKDKIVAASNGKWTLYTKSDEMEGQIYAEIQSITGFNQTQAKQALANYLGSGKKLSVLKKQLIKQGAMTPKADTLKKSGAAKTQEEKDKEAAEKAEAGYTPAPTPATGTPPVDTGKPTPNRVKEEAQDKGDISKITPANKALLFKQFKDKGFNSYLSSGTGANYEAFAAVQAWAKGQGKDYTLLQLVRVIDEEGAKKAGVDNGHLFEKKVITWLTTPAGTQYLKDQEAKLAKQAEEEKKKAEAAKLAKELEDKQPPLPADSALYQEMTPQKALEFQRRMLEAKPFGPGEKAGLAHYTGGAYNEMNNYLRGLSTSVSSVSKGHIEKAKRGFRPAPEPMLLRRGTGANQFLTLGVKRGETSLLWGITGKTFEDKGFMSTSAAGRSAFSGEVALEVECPVGAPVMYVDKMYDGTRFSRHPGENEMVLAPGCKYKILNVRKSGNTFVVRVRVVDWPGK